MIRHRSHAKVLIWPEQAKGANGKNVIIGEERPKNVNDKILAREVVLKKTPDGKESQNYCKGLLEGGARQFHQTHAPRGLYLKDQ